jgi:hypothetical protein
VDPRVDLDDLEKRKFVTLMGLELRRLGRPARSQSLYRLRYPGSFVSIYKKRRCANAIRIQCFKTIIKRKHAQYIRRNMTYSPYAKTYTRRPCS